MDINQFFDKYNGLAVDKDGAYGPQCMDLYNAYQEDVFEREAIGAPAAKDVWEKDMYNNELFYKIEYVDGFMPQKGDVAVWSGIGKAAPYGHISICTGASDSISFESFDQNWGGAYCHFVWHDYLDGFLGVLRPKENSIYNHNVGELVVYSSCYRNNNDEIGMHIDCIRSYGAWQQQYISEIVGGNNPYKLSNGLYVNDGDIREVK